MLKEKRAFGIFLVISSILFLIYLNLNSSFLIPKGYDLSIDGYVISRTMVIIFTLYVLIKVGILLLKYEKKD